MQTTRFEQKSFTYMNLEHHLIKDVNQNNPMNLPNFEYIIDQYKSMGVSNVYFGNVTHWDEKNNVFDSTAKNGYGYTTGMTTENIMKNVDYFHSKGLTVTLRPQVTDLEFVNGNYVYTNFNPSTKSGDKAAFFQQYTAYMVDLAKNAQAHGVEAISIGNEMYQFTTAETKGYWENLISQIRSVYSGKLTYAALAGFDATWPTSEMSQIKWFDKLDFIGIDFYPQLTLNKDATYQDFVKGLYGDNPWKFNWVNYLKNLVDTTGKKIMFTEFGAPSFDGAGTRQNSDASATNNALSSDQQEQADYFKAVYSVLSSELGDKFIGTAIWDGLSRSSAENNGNNNDYTVIDKLAENVVRTAYTDGELDGLTKTISGTYSGSFNNDTITGSSGADSVSGGRGSDTINLGTGNDTVVINASYGANVRLKIEGSTLIVKSEDGTDRLTNVETIQFNNFKLDASVFSSSADPLNIYRFYNTQTGTHFYSNSPTERNAVLNTADQFLYEGVGFKALAKGDDPVYRFYNANTGTHFYTIDAKERDAVKALAGFQFEGIAYTASDTKIDGSHELFRFYNTKTGTHFYTDNVGERDAVKLIGNFQYEGVAYYVG